MGTTGKPAELALEAEVRQLRARIAELESERQSALAAVEEEKDRLAAVIASISDEVWFADVNKRVTLANPAARRTFNLSAGDEIGIETLVARIEVYRRDGSARPLEEAPALRALAGETIRNEEEIVRTPTAGQLQHRLLSSAPVKDRDGNTIGSATVVRDITEQKRAEEALRTERERLRITLASIGDAVLATDAMGNIAAFNPVAARLTGWTEEEALGRRAQDLFRRIHQVTREPAEDIIERVLKENTVVALAEHSALLTRSGGEIPIEETAAPIRDSAGGVTGAVLVFHDITTKRRSQAAVEAAHAQAVNEKNRLNALLDALPVGVALIDAQGGTIASNPQFEEVWGGPRPPTVSVRDYAAYKGWWADTGAPVEPEEWASARAVQKGETVLNQEVRIERFDGTRVIVLNSAAPIRDAEGRIAGSAVAIQEITELKRAEEALKENEAVLRTFFDSPGVMRGIAEMVDGRIVHVSCNEYAARVYGVDRESIRDKSIIEAGGTEEIARMWTGLYEESRRTGEPVSVEYARPCADGKQRWLLGTACYLGTGPTGQARFGYTCIDLTDRKRAEEQVSQSQRTFSELVERAPYGIYVVDSQFRIAHMNTASQTGAFRNVRPVMGRDVGEALRILWPEPVAADVVATFRHTLETGEPYYSPRFVNPRHDLTTVESYEWELHRMMLPDGQYGVICYFFDSTKLREVEAAARESEAKYRELFESIDQGFCTLEVLFDGAGKPVDYEFLMVNPAFERQTGIPNAEGRRMRDIAPRHEEHWFETYGRIAVTGEPMRFENAAAQLQRYYEVFAWKIGTPDERKVGVLFNDISDRKRADQALRDSEERLRLAQDAAGIGTFEWNLESGVNIWSPKLEELYGLPAGGFAGTRAAWEELVHPEDRAGAVESANHAIENGEPGEAEFRVVWPDGSVHWMSGRWQLFKDASGRPVRLAGVNIDITQRKQTEERLRHSQKLESLGLLAGGVAHDFNNLLVGVIGNASLAQEMLPPDHAAAELMETVVKTGEQAAHLTRQMLAYSGKGKFLLERLEISALVRDIIELVRPSIPKKIALQLDLDEDLLSIEADRGQVQQILMNLAINAAEAIGSREGLITIRTGTQVVDEQYRRRRPEAAELPPGRYVVLEVADTGSGMDAGVKAKIFDPFFSTKFTGRGLGLAAVAGIVRGHKGAIYATSAPGEGTTFTVLFPAAAQPAEVRPEAAPSAVAQGSGVVLVIDDEPVVRTMAERALTRIGYTVLVADDGLAAIDILKRRPGNIDLILLDLSMPGMSGEEALPELRKIRPGVRVILSSGYSEAEAMTMFQGQRVSGFVQKPYTSVVLAEKVREALE
jgi:PAS domain S-box-containing protein